MASGEVRTQDLESENRTIKSQAVNYPHPLVATLYMPLLILVLWRGRETKAEPEPNPNANVTFAW